MNAEWYPFKIIYLNKVDSTNLYAQELLKKEKFAHARVIVANEQTDGRGQRGAKWLSNPNENLTFSLVLQPHFLPVEKVFYLSKIIALSIADFLDKMSVANVRIKWPNDVYVNSKKIAGILIENSISGAKISSSVVGVGLNINQDKFCGDLQATSLSIIHQKKYELRECLLKLLTCIKKRYELLSSNSYEVINQDYLSQLFAFRERKKFSDLDSQFYGKIVGVDEAGHLLVEKENAIVKTYGLKEIKLIS